VVKNPPQRRQFASAGLPAGITERPASPDYQAATERAGSIPVSSTPAELRAVIDQTLADVQQTVQEFGLQQEQQPSTSERRSPIYGFCALRRLHCAHQM
jgi:hypothetical protein